jgi:hypothetical protein
MAHPLIVKASAVENESPENCDIDLSFDQEKRTLIAAATPPANAASVDEDWLRERLSAGGYADLHFLSDNAARFLAQYNAGQAVEGLKLAEAVDATIKVTLTPDGLEARLDIAPAEGGTAASRDAVLAALNKAGVAFGIQEEAIDSAVASGSAVGEVVARGEAPEHGINGWLEPLIPQVRDRRPHEDESGHIDYHDLGEIMVVHPGDPLMRLHPPTVGKDGCTVSGKPLPARPGKPVKFAGKLAGASPSPDDPDLLLAEITGQPVIVRDGMTVEPVFKVDRVGSASGNINFEGNVAVRGDVDAGMIVRATGDIEIGGVVDLATLEAGGNIVIKGGVIGGLGHAGAGEQHVRCGGSFNATYAQQASIEAGDSIFIDDMALQCELTALNHITIGNKRRGHLIGGTARATLSITARVVGSPNQGQTHLAAGFDPKMRKQLLELQRQRDERRKQLDEVEKLLVFAQSCPEKITPAIAAKAQATATALEGEISELEATHEALEHKIELTQEARIIVEQSLLEGSDIHLGTQHYHAPHDHGPCTFGLDENGLLKKL